MICPHCDVSIHEDFEEFPLFGSKKEPYGWSVSAQLCPECGEPILRLLKGHSDLEPDDFAGIEPEAEYEEVQVWPVGSSRKCPSEVPSGLREDFLEAASVLTLSPKASAALSRRCLQHLLREHGGTASKDLSKQIEEVVRTHALPSELEGQLDAIRNIGNFAAHPQKDRATGEILPVEPLEAEWNLDVLEELFDHYFTKPARIKKRKEDLNKKLVAAGKPPLEP